MRDQHTAAFRSAAALTVADGVAVVLAAACTGNAWLVAGASVVTVITAAMTVFLWFARRKARADRQAFDLAVANAREDHIRRR